MHKQNQTARSSKSNSRQQKIYKSKYTRFKANSIQYNKNDTEYRQIIKTAQINKRRNRKYRIRQIPTRTTTKM